MIWQTHITITKVIDSEEFAAGQNEEPNLMLFPVAPGRFHACWTLCPALLDQGQRAFGLGGDGVKLVLRAFSFTGEAGDYGQAHATEDFPVSGLHNNGYFDLGSAPESVSGVLGLVNPHGQFRPLVRGDAVALPQHAYAPEPAAPKPTPAPTASAPLDEAQVLARLPRLTNLPEELLISPKKLAFFERINGETIFEPEAAPLTFSAVLDENSVHEAILSGNCQILTAAVTTVLPAAPQPTKHTGSSELLASQWTDQWDDHAPISLRAELIINGRLSPGHTLALGDKAIKPLPGGHFKIIRKLSAFAEVFPLLAMLGHISKDAGALNFVKDAAGKPVLELHASVLIEGRINDPDYAKFLPEGVKTDADGRFSLHREAPNGALLLPGLSLIAHP